MKTFAVAMSQSAVQVLLDRAFPGVLVSFAHDKGGKILSGAVDSGISVMIDSGAFTAWTVGRSVDIAGFVSYATGRLVQFPDAVIVNLDVIPGTVHDSVVAERVRREAIDQSANNAEILRAAGLPIMEVFHLGEPLSVLDEILDRRRPGERIGLGGLASQRTGPGFSVKRQFCVGTFGHLKSRFGFEALPPIHGLGIAPDGPIGGAMFPWASVDCSSWASLAKYGVGVNRNGRRLRGRSDPRVRNRALADFYSGRVLDRWGETRRCLFKALGGSRYHLR